MHCSWLIVTIYYELQHRLEPQIVSQKVNSSHKQFKHLDSCDLSERKVALHREPLALHGHWAILTRLKPTPLCH